VKKKKEKKQTMRWERYSMQKSRCAENAEVNLAGITPVAASRRERKD